MSWKDCSMGSTNPAFNTLQPNVDDPLGTNLKRRGMDAYYAEARQSDPNYMSGPLPDPQWEGLFQAMKEQGVGKVGMDSGRPSGIADDPEWWKSGDVGALAPTTDPNAMNTADLTNYARMQSNNLAGPQAPTSKTLGLEGLVTALKGKKKVK